MSSFEDDFAAAAAANILAALGEPIGYTPKGGVRREIQATVDRHPEETRGQAYAGYAVLEILRDGVDGADPITRGGDAFHFSARSGEPEGTFRNIEILTQDAGLWTLKVYTHGS